MKIQKRFIALAIATLSLLPIGLSWADPVVVPPPPPPAEPPIFLPAVFCFRITDIVKVETDLEHDRFRFEFEVLNWGNREAFGVNIARTRFSRMQDGRAGMDNDGRPPIIVYASVDNNGRPLGVGNDDGNFSPADGTTTPPKIGQDNSFAVTTKKFSTVTWQGSLGLPFRDLFGVTSTAQACALVPGCVVQAGLPRVLDEAIDNTVGPDNVLDGFFIVLDDFDPGEIFSFNWLLLGVDGQPIPNPFGNGVFNLHRAGGDFDDMPLFRSRVGNNTGTTTNPRDLFVSRIPDGKGGFIQFEAEFGAGVTAPFFFPTDNIFDIDPDFFAVND